MTLAADAPPAGATFDSLDPATGAVVGVFPVHDADAVAADGRAGPRGARRGGGRSASTAAAARLTAYRGYLARRHARAGRPGAPGERQAARRRDPRDRPGRRPPGLGRRARPQDPPAAPGAAGPARGQPRGLPGVPAARRRRRHRAVELPGLHADGLDRLRAGRRQRRRLQALASTPRPSAPGWPPPGGPPSPTPPTSSRS